MSYDFKADYSEGAVGCPKLIIDGARGRNPHSDFPGPASAHGANSTVPRGSCCITRGSCVGGFLTGYVAGTCAEAAAA
jgi:hypothetical protein